MRNRDRYFDQGLVFADEPGGIVDLDVISKAFATLPAPRASRPREYPCTLVGTFAQPRRWLPVTTSGRSPRCSARQTRECAAYVRAEARRAAGQN